jgi:hypothetical protein
MPRGGRDLRGSPACHPGCEKEATALIDVRGREIPLPIPQAPSALANGWAVGKRSTSGNARRTWSTAIAFPTPTMVAEVPRPGSSPAVSSG